MTKLVLTDRFAATCKADSEPQTDYFDARTSGLALRVSVAGHKAWTYHFTSPRDGKRARLSLGTYPSTSLAGARTKAREARGYLEEDLPRDPRDVIASSEAGAMTVAALIPLFLEKPHRRTGKPRKSVNEIARRLRVNVTPIIGNVKLTDLHRRDIARVIAPIMRRKRPAEALRVFHDCHGMVRWAVGQGYLDRNIMEAMEPPAAAASSERVLTQKEIKILWTGLPKSLPQVVNCQRIIMLCLLTAQRVGEVAGMQPGEIDFKTSVWKIPGARRKNGESHDVPLTSSAINIIREALADIETGAKYLFPNSAKNGSLPPHRVARAIWRAQERFGIAPWSAHDLRRTAVTLMGELGIAPFIRAHVVGHISITKANVLGRHYDHYDYSREKRAALELWDERLSAIVEEAEPAKLLPMGARRG